MKILISFPSLFGVLAAMSLASLALAQEQRSAGREYRERHEGTGILALPRQSERANEERSGTAEYAMSVPQQRRERMSLEERRQLRRDINDAGREIYRPAHLGHP